MGCRELNIRDFFILRKSQVVLSPDSKAESMAEYDLDPLYSHHHAKHWGKYSIPGEDGEGGEEGEPPTWTVEAKDHLDLQVDSDNNNGYDPPDGSSEEDTIEEDEPGKIFQVNDGDLDSDGVPDFADGFAAFDEPQYAQIDNAGDKLPFIPVLLELPAGIDMNKTSISFDYRESTPEGIKENNSGNDKGVRRTRVGTDHEDNPIYEYSATPGFRLWTHRGGQRDPKSVINDGHFIPANTEIPADKLADKQVFKDRVATLYLEAVPGAEEFTGDSTMITVKASFTSPKQGKIEFEDKVRVRPIKVDLDVDSNNDNRYKTPEYDDAEDKIEEKNPGKVIIVNVDDDDGDGKPDNEDNKINGPKDKKKDMPPMRLTVEPDIDQLGDNFELYLKLSNYQKVRIFNTKSDEHLIGVEKTESLKLEKKHFTNGVFNMKVEGVKTGKVTISVVTKDDKVLDKVLVKVSDTLAMGLNKIPPFRFANIMQRRDTNRECPKCKTQNLTGHPFDLFHVAYAQNCKHCNTYCTRASVAMINYTYGGLLSQDRISIYGYNQEMWTDPNNKLGHGIGLYWQARKVNPLAWALTLNKTAITEYQTSTWHDVANALVTNRPIGIVWMAGSGILYQHSSVICGVKINQYGIKEIQLADPTERKIDWYAYKGFKKRIKTLYIIKDNSVDSIKAIKKQ